MPEHARAAVGVVVVNDDDEVLLIRRGPDAAVGAGEWAFPGGKVDAGRTILETASDELVQETGLKALDGRRMAIVSEDLFWGPEDHFVTSYVLITGFAGTAMVAEPHKHSAVRWMTIDHLREAVERGTMPIFGPLRAFVTQKGLDEVRDMTDPGGNPISVAVSAIAAVVCLLVGFGMGGAGIAGFAMTLCWIAMAAGAVACAIGRLPTSPGRRR